MISQHYWRKFQSPRHQITHFSGLIKHLLLEVPDFETKLKTFLCYGVTNQNFRQIGQEVYELSLDTQTNKTHITLIFCCLKMKLIPLIFLTIKIFFQLIKYLKITTVFMVSALNHLVF